MKTVFTLFLAITTLHVLIAQNQELTINTFAFYDSTGTELTYNQVIKSVSQADVILFGELHNDAMIHYIQLRMVKDLMKFNNIILGSEIFERDDQLKINEYLSGLIPAKNFESEARLWPNYKTDYKPILDLARDSGITFIATNVPRRYAALVAKSGLDTLNTLSKEAKQYLPALPIDFTLETPKYQEMLDMMGGHGSNPERIVQAQALKDATMAESIANNTEKNTILLHINGDFHSANYGGIYWYLKKLKPKLNVKTIKVYTESSLDFNQEFAGTGDIILVVPEDFTKTH
ncbi:ChaN family lipoprotein [Cryomorpha ignava]|uniref:ChaN family lipoprotein n=1 Tax=Cryomorpha ignava TaxID=101383 RepID=A0A7K3WR18_9FLAO|nr:ChaN family lipoprotein [Cryomorpha ignava]NEN24129.1 ChaN family lipoprotein [Cryomorpha ignava]